ncbi:hypothetical protein D3C78_1228860 [compost metagenome]
MKRRERLIRGKRHGETLFLRNVWWPLFECFDDLHPEYEIPDWRGRSYFGDFAYLPDPLKFMIEIKGYGPHVRDMDRVKYTHELNRELYLQSLQKVHLNSPFLLKLPSIGQYSCTFTLT